MREEFVVLGLEVDWNPQVVVEDERSLFGCDRQRIAQAVHVHLALDLPHLLKGQVNALHLVAGR